MKPAPIYLASASPRRHEILLQMGVEHEVLNVPAPEGEDEPRLANEAPEAYVLRTAREKAIRARQWLARQRAPGAAAALDAARPVLSADTTVILDGDILGKPAGLDEARRMLARLSGGTHVVHTAVVLARDGQLLQDVSITQVRFKPLSEAEIDAYCATGEPMGKAGAYGIQGRAAVFIEYIAGSYTGVMGLPVFETWRLLQSGQAQS
ncbi:Maf family protein [Pollutimonas bauzanensis]|uniref:dTTP/UTP pyrophosphatase n=1 Tax=Pollutimonas bauzanensis TaxID=658167 RepID=A0A1M5NRS0_9BURK|nr:nucleoside triphosphate pyrophosphatase [Pollutimonas bauzanensis]SHG92168.1 septum formation protein [Pollutimonas bauzanensis]